MATVGINRLKIVDTFSSNGAMSAPGAGNDMIKGAGKVSGGLSSPTPCQLTLSKQYITFLRMVQ